MEGISNGLRHLISYPGVLGSKACSCCLPFGCCFCKSHPKLINSPCHEPKSRVQQRLSSSRRQSRSHSSRSQLQTFPAVIWASALAAQAGSVLELCCWSGACGVTSLWLPEELCSWLGEPTPHPKGQTAGAGECAGHTGSWWLCFHRAAACDAGVAPLVKQISLNVRPGQEEILRKAASSSHPYLPLTKLILN